MTMPKIKTSSTAELTRQGVRDLNPRGHSNPPRRRLGHRHFYAGPLEVVGYRNAPGDILGDMEEDPIWAQRCIHCGVIGPGH